MPSTAARLAVAAAMIVSTSVLAAQQPPRAPTPGPDSPEPVIRAFYRALLLGDAAAFHKVIVVEPLADKFLPRDALSPETAHEVEMESMDFSMRQTQPFRAHGKEVGVDAAGHYPVGTTSRYLANFPKSLTVVTVVRKADGWKVDLRWWEALVMLTGDGPEPGSAEYAVKLLTAALVTLRRDEASKVIVPDGKLEVLFAGAPSAPEPSDQMILARRRNAVGRDRAGRVRPDAVGHDCRGCERPLEESAGRALRAARAAVCRPQAGRGMARRR